MNRGRCIIDLFLIMLMLVSCEQVSVDDNIIESYQLYQYTDFNDAQYVFISQRGDLIPTIYSWNFLSENVFNEVAEGNFSLNLSKGYHIDKYVYSHKTFCSSLKWYDLSELKSNKYALGDQYVWCGEGDSILCGIDEFDDYEDVWQYWSTPNSYSIRIVLDKRFNVEKFPRMNFIRVNYEQIERLFMTTYAYHPAISLIPDYRDHRVIDIGDEEDIKCYPFQKPAYEYSHEEADEIRKKAFIMKAGDIRADYVKLFNHIIENDELDKYKIKL